MVTPQYSLGYFFQGIPKDTYDGGLIRDAYGAPHVSKVCNISQIGW